MSGSEILNQLFINILFFIMKLDHPSLAEARHYYNYNRSYFDTLSAYYSVHEKEYYGDVFKKIESENLRGGKRSFCNPRNHFLILAAGMIMFGYYLFPVEIETDDSVYEKGYCSLDLTVISNSYFDKALMKFNKGRYTRAKEYLLKVESDDENYDKAKLMLNIIEEKIDTEGLTDTDVDQYPVF